MATAPAPPDPQPAEEDALRTALAALVAPLAQLAVSRGLPHAVLDEILKSAFVAAADAAHPELLPHRKTSRIATATGLNRREVARLQAAAPRPGARTLSPVAQLFAHWSSAAPYLDAAGRPRVLPRSGAEPSFETLAACVTRDVHPRSLLDEALRLRLARWDPEADTVALARSVFVPQGDPARLLGFLGENVGDHLRAAVENVLAETPPGTPSPHLEQAVFADGLALSSLEAMRPAISAQWRSLLAALVPLLEARVAADAAAAAAEGTAAPAEPARGRLRVGLYSYFEHPDLGVAAAPAPRPPKRVRGKAVPAPSPEEDS